MTNIAWADNADVISEQYTGTGALKNDFTRTGKRSVKGIATDGLNSMRRFGILIFNEKLNFKKFEMDRSDFVFSVSKKICGV